MYHSIWNINQMEILIQSQYLNHLRWRHRQDYYHYYNFFNFRLKKVLLSHNSFSPSMTFWRRLKEILRRRLKDVLKTLWRCLERQEIVTLKKSSKRLQLMSGRRLGDKKKFAGLDCVPTLHRKIKPSVKDFFGRISFLFLDP